MGDDLVDGTTHRLHPRVRLAWTAAGAVLGLVIAVMAALVALAGGSAVAALTWFVAMGVNQ